jgi:hypothetical protein
MEMFYRFRSTSRNWGIGNSWTGKRPKLLNYEITHLPGRATRNSLNPTANPALVYNI